VNGVARRRLAAYGLLAGILALLCLLGMLVRAAAPSRRALSLALAQRELLAKKAESDLRYFYRLQWPVVEKLQPRVDNWHVDAICDHLQATIADVDAYPQINRLVINVPPRNSKSSTTCVALPAWTWGPRHLPGKRFMYITHSLRLSRRDSVTTRRVITSGWYQENWGDRFQLLVGQKTKDRFENNQTGYRMIGSFHGGSVIGEGADILGLDDPIDPDSADNPNELERIIETYDGALVGRLNDQLRGVIILIMQRLAENDLCGHVLKQAGWTHLRLPTEFEVEDRCRTFVYVRKEPAAAGVEPAISPWAGVVTAASTLTRCSFAAGSAESSKEPERVLFFEDPRTEDGELLNPKRFPREAVNLLKTNDWVFAAQQQQRPAPRGGQILQEAWWRYYDAKPVDEKGQARKPDHGAQSWDLAFKDLKTSDNVGFVAGELYGPDIYLIDHFANRAGFSASCDLIRQKRTQHPHLHAILVEDKANGPAVMEVLRKEIPGILAVEPKGGKIARAYAAQPTLKSGNVYLPNPVDPRTGKLILERAWVKTFIASCSVFPKGLRDDDVDAFTQLVTYLQGTHSAMLAYLKQLKAKDAERQQREAERA
jgi:predicted phage terminase large subunit-like protein